MTPLVSLIIGLTVAAIVGIVVVLSRQGHGESAAGHKARFDDPANGSMLRAPGSRPGGPGQAGEAVVGPGTIAPGDPDGRSGHRGDVESSDASTKPHTDGARPR